MVEVCTNKDYDYDVYVEFLRNPIQDIELPKSVLEFIERRSGPTSPLKKHSPFRKS